MLFPVNLRQAAKDTLVWAGEVPVSALDLGPLDELIQAPYPLAYRLAAQVLEGALLVQGRLELVLACECVRCLRAFDYPIRLEDWACHLPLSGADAVAIHHDCVDLTPYVREDILLAFPQYPLCDVECRGLPAAATDRPPEASGAPAGEDRASVWAELNKLKL